MMAIIVRMMWVFLFMQSYGQKIVSTFEIGNIDEATKDVDGTLKDRSCEIRARAKTWAILNC